MNKQRSTRGQADVGEPLEQVLGPFILHVLVNPGGVRGVVLFRHILNGGEGFHIHTHRHLIQFAHHRIELGGSPKEGQIGNIALVLTEIAAQVKNLVLPSLALESTSYVNRKATCLPSWYCSCVLRPNSLINSRHGS